MKIAKLLGALSLILGTQTLAAQSVTYDVDKAIDFSKYKTYAWVDAGNIPDDFNHKRIVGAVDAQLGAHALTQVAQTGNPDILVSYRAGFEQGLEVNANSTDFGPYRWGNRTGSARARRDRGNAVRPSARCQHAFGRVACGGDRGHRQDGQPGEARSQHSQGCREDVQALPTQSLTRRQP